MPHSAIKPEVLQAEAKPRRRRKLLTGAALEQYVADLRTELEAEEARMNAEKQFHMTHPHTVEETEEILQISRQTVFMLCKHHRLASRQVRSGKGAGGGRKRVMINLRPSDVKRLQAELRRKKLAEE